MNVCKCFEFIKHRSKMLNVLVLSKKLWPVFLKFAVFKLLCPFEIWIACHMSWKYFYFLHKLSLNLLCFFVFSLKFWFSSQKSSSNVKINVNLLLPYKNMQTGKNLTSKGLSNKSLCEKNESTAAAAEWDLRNKSTTL